MSEYKGSEFVGIVETLKVKSSYYEYCSLNTQTKGCYHGNISIQDLGEHVAILFGENFRQQITFEPPQGFEITRTISGLRTQKYHRLSVLEQDRFEKSVLNQLQSKE